KNKMRVYGLDFTSAPSSGMSSAKNRKRLILAVCTLENNILEVENLAEPTERIREIFPDLSNGCVRKGNGLPVWIFPLVNPRCRRMREKNYGVPDDADSIEGWICDPQIFSGQG
ncbi:MAG: hypothetical protein AB7S77_13500, partial [Desulfatirhabdiaceae bacterium]